ncbi:MAG: metalloregulator ArsR/SmtB family transcription factor [Actinomycetia bacterium]|nr:metalloregulator ArsR/SmtB family transcription factor [Actinomycetes bacterium]MCH9766872.1 metalloregulator ArsR/SmtB family transcription factor [Actinomycetes bacterium]
MTTVSTMADATAGHDPHLQAGAPAREAPAQAVLDRAGDLLRALAAPVRIAIVLQLREDARCVHELVDALDVAQPLVSQHLRILKAAGVVDGARSGREVLYRLVDHHLADIVIAAVTHAAEDEEIGQ